MKTEIETKNTIFFTETETETETEIEVASRSKPTQIGTGARQ